MNNIPHPRRVKSFVKRDGRMTDAQREALLRLSSQFVLKLDDGLIDYREVFNREAPTNFEIGFGSGRSLLEMAKRYPEENFIGVEMHQPGIGGLLLGMEINKVDNIRIYYADAVEVLARAIPEMSLDVIQIFFPDPWQKRKHHKRRLIQPEFVNMLATKLKPQGKLHLATDWEDYSIHMMKVLSQAEAFINLAGHGNFSERSSQRPIVTKFEARGERVGRTIWELQFVKC
jgi:tRNA (guanine-N7-)-methyltransferase